MKNVRIGGVPFPVEELATQGDAVLGIRGSGKTSLAGLMAELLMDAGIPITVFDPIGVWRYLKVPARHSQGKGYPVVVAGGRAADLPLTVQSAPEIMRAALIGKISVVFDLYDKNLSATDRCRVVEQCVKLMLYENDAYGPRKVFIEEAAQYAPQMVRPDKAAVYGAIDEFARMGRNSMLGYCLINQRPQAINKEVLENAGVLFLGRQKGRHAIKAIGDWLEANSLEDQPEIFRSLPTLKTGEFWVWPEAGSPIRVMAERKHSYHPERTGQSVVVSSKLKPVDVSDFVGKMSGSLERLLKEKQENDPALLRRRIVELERELKSRPAQEIVKTVEVVPAWVSVRADKIHQALLGLRDEVDGLKLEASKDWSGVGTLKGVEHGISALSPRRKLVSQTTFPESVVVRMDESKITSSLSGVKLRAGELAMLKATATLGGEVSEPRVGALTGFPHSGDTFKTYRGTLIRQGLWAKDYFGYVKLTEAGWQMARTVGYEPEPRTVDELVRMWSEKLRAGEKRLLNHFAVGHASSFDDLLRIIPNRETLKTYIGTLNRLKLVEVYDGKFRLHHALGGR